MLEATAKGFASDVTVSLTVENGAIATFSVDASGETAGLASGPWRTTSPASLSASLRP